ncbi:hypothetical protein [Desertibacillus haloalkaliphilus]|uniref:hypothetical protein n=1 Tax=Desertibacillus haloalkaliphilus TaxID=1328930 RepID=UPI001C26D4A3|nr:hypothetical protein [Desertibacillus haloalkaliphilus]MBU8906141.1 hypothetical protein [Desertibacillus haloalkaliphilus]
MTKKQKIVYRISIAVNIMLVLAITWGYMKVNFASEQIFLTEVQDNLIELEGLIAHQQENDWSEPNLVTSKLGDVIDGLWIGLQTGEHLNTLSRNDHRTLHQFYTLLGTRYPNDRLYSFSEVSEQDKEHLLELREHLREFGMGLNISISYDMNSFMNSITTVNDNIEENHLK